MSIQSKVNKALGIGGKTPKVMPATANTFSTGPVMSVKYEPLPGPFHGTFAESKEDKELRLSQDVRDKARASVHAADPNNHSDIKIKMKRMEDAEKHYHKLWIAHDKEVKATEAKAAKQKTRKD